MYCPYCKAENLKLAVACNQCGKNLSTIKNISEYYCTSCDSDVPVDANYCWNCGTTLEEKDNKASGVSSEITKQPKSRSLKANKKIVDESSCKICSNRFSIGDDIELCENCQNYYHKKCWEQSAGCNQSSCREEMKSCPHCGKLIKEAALKCRYCGKYLDTSLEEKHIKKGVLKHATTALTYAIIGIFCFGFILGPMAISMGNKAIKTIDSEPGWEGRGKAKAAIIIGWIEVALTILYVIIMLSSR